MIEVLVNEGQLVTNGQVLARTDDTEIQHSLRIAEQEKARYEAEADRLQLLADDGNRRLRNAFGAVACAPVVAAPFADGPVRALRALGVLVGRWPAHL